MCTHSIYVYCVYTVYISIYIYIHIYCLYCNKTGVFFVQNPAFVESFHLAANTNSHVSESFMKRYLSLRDSENLFLTIAHEQI